MTLVSIDGYIIFLHCGATNTASSVLEQSVKACATFGVPSRERSDHGTFNGKSTCIDATNTDRLCGFVNDESRLSYHCNAKMKMVRRTSQVILYGHGDERSQMEWQSAKENVRSLNENADETTFENVNQKTKIILLLYTVFHMELMRRNEKKTNQNTMQCRA
ncbi:unnamed protein product [Mytilus coruscus]|uniref:Integrase core domain-containing protein n=1 Tax=Mytilus coruscus TaxID=42192 RepID=A0A6J8DKT9_MYTCO|nr:unnamed protein product [Mytilus coruscus]